MKNHSRWFNRNLADFNSFPKTLEIMDPDTERILLREGNVYPKLPA